MTAPSSLSVVYCVDEDIARVALGDFGQITPSYQKLAAGVDGVFSSGSPWVLTSAVDFEAAGVAYGHVVWLTAPQSTYRGNGEFLGVSAVSGTSLTLRRIGMGDSVGSPPGSGGVTGVAFKVLTLYPQIEDASYEINRLYGIDPTGTVIPNRKPDNRTDARDLTRFCVYKVLVNCYEVANRSANGEFSIKLKQIMADHDALKSHLLVRWGADGQAEMPTSVFGTSATR